MRPVLTVALVFGFSISLFANQEVNVVSVEQFISPGSPPTIQSTLWTFDHPIIAFNGAVEDLNVVVHDELVNDWRFVNHSYQNDDYSVWLLWSNTVFSIDRWEIRGNPVAFAAENGYTIPMQSGSVITETPEPVTLCIFSVGLLFLRRKYGS